MLHLQLAIRSALVLAASTVLALTPVTVDAATQTTFDEDFSPFEVNDLCAFPVTVSGHQVGHQVENVIGHGITLLRIHVTEQDVFTANGVTVTSSAYSFNIKIKVDSDGNILELAQTGLIIRVPLPTGQTFQATGRAEYDPTTDFVTVPTHGASKNLDAFCAVMSG